MIQNSFQHVKGIGPVAERRILDAGIADWEEALAARESLPLTGCIADALIEELPRCLDALRSADLKYLLDRFDTREHWRIFAGCFESATYFDIETSGFGSFCDVTVIGCLHRGSVRVFTRNDDLDDFLELLDDVSLLVSFNGNSFDVPRLLDHYHIPELPCPHLDLRWLCYHCGYRGGLKDIEAQLDIERPVSVSGVDGADATWLWERWDLADDAAALQQLRCYCAADVLTMPVIAACILRDRGVETPGAMHRVGWDLLETMDNG